MPESLASQVEVVRAELVERLSDVDEEVADLYLAEKPLEPEVLKAAIRRATISLKFIPVLMGSAFKNKGAVGNCGWGCGPVQGEHIAKCTNPNGFSHLDDCPCMTGFTSDTGDGC